ncbi:TldD/PmbA family protein [Cyanobacterium sp. IPPAS B-1200]|uniref:TldD/PmbA family protein n=1 Tax=Cyanobacterium sp. IPPAS B-1200 TaxID=1562720 RepID=UPI0008526379|nr:TldD/PmbA family protein [Cyanobacterium sp. IPPAS B-1200]OEJ80117.1 peptidase C69 [Cyanobacterium sp. IPPAS B-1200]
MEAEALLDLAQRRGVGDLEVYQVRSHSKPISFEANKLKQIESSQGGGMALRLWRNGCPGLAVAYGDFDGDDLIDKALAISALNEPETPLLNGQNRLIYPASEVRADINILMEEGRRAIALLREAQPEILCSLDLEWETETTTIINSRGLHCQYTDTSLSASVGVEWVREDDFLAIYDSVYDNKKLDLSKIIKSILQRLEWAKNQGTIESRPLPVLFTPNAVTSLWETVSDALDGKRIVDKSSPWYDCHGKKVISSAVSIAQNSHLQPYYCPFDDEGSVTQSYKLIDAGEIANFYCDKKNAEKLGIKNTGNGFRPSLGSYPTPSLVNFVVDGGNTLFDKLVESMDYGLIVDQFLGNDADISGDFSLNVDLGYVVEKGEVIGRVKDTMISGNIYQLLERVKDLGNDNMWSGSCYTPSMVIDGVSVTN